MELKTLKDLEKEHEEYSYEDSNVDADELKEEAIKWIKEMVDDTNLTYGYGIFNTETKQVMDYVCPNSNIILWIKHFFNITDDDLK